MPDIAARVFDLVDRIAAAGTPHDAWSAYLAASRDCGFDHGIVFLAVGDHKLCQRGYAEAMPPGWITAYSSYGCEQIDTLAARMPHAIAPFDFRIADWHGDAARRNWHDLNHDSGLHAGMLIPYRADGVLRGIGLCGREASIHPHDRKALIFAGLELLARLREMNARPEAASEPALSERERECLEWVAMGKSDWEIGIILSLSEKTVNVYVERAKHKLKAATRTHAIVLALRRGAIYP